MSYSQVNITINKNGISTTIDLWDISITLLNPEQQIIDIELTVYNNNEDVLYKGIKEQVIILGMQRYIIAPTTLTGITEEYNFPQTEEKKKITDKNKIPAGDYVLCVSIFSHEPKVELNRSCDFITVKNSITDSLLQAGRNRIPGLNFQLHGSAEIFSYMDVFTDKNALTIAHRNSGIYINPSLQAFGYPVTASIYYDTDSDFYYQNIPTFQFNFDTKEYQTILEARLQQKLEERSGIDPAKYASAVSMIEEFNGLESLTNNAYFQNEMQYLDSLQVYENYLSDSVAVDVLNKKIEEYSAKDYEQLLADSLNSDSSEVYRQALATKDSLIQVKDSVLQKIEKANELISKAKSYKNILDKKEELQQTILQDSSVAVVKSHYDEFQNFDAGTLTDPEAVKEKLKNIDQLKKIESFVSGFNALQFGATVPNYSEFSISGVLLNGLNVNYTIGNFNLIGIAGRINDNLSLFQQDKSQNTYSKLYVAGYEQKVTEKFTYSLYMLNSDFTDEDSLSFYNFLESNNTIAGKFNSLIFRNKIKLEGDVALSYAQNKDVLAFDDPEAGDQSKSGFWLFQTIAQNDNFDDGSFTDKAGKLTLSSVLFKNNTTLSLTSRYVGSGFYTPGNPFLLNDVFNIEFGVDQNLLKRKVLVSAHIIKNRDNLEGLKETTTSYYNMKAGLRINYPKLPMISIDYLPNVIINNYDQIEVNTLSATSAYSYKIGKIPCIASVSFIKLHTLSAANDTTNFHSRFYNVINNLNFKKFSVQTCWNLNEAFSFTENISFQTISVGTRFTALKYLEIFTNLQMTGDKNNAFDPGGLLEINVNAIKAMGFKLGIYVYPEQSIEYITNIQNISSTYAYFSAIFNF